MNKPKSKLETKLSEEQQAKLADWLLGGMQYHQAQQVVAKEFGLTVSLGAFTTFWERYCAPSLQQRRHKALVAADAFEKTETDAKIDAAFVKQLKQMAFEITLEPNPDPDKVFMIISQALKLRDQDLKERQIAQGDKRIEMLERKLKEAGERQERLNDAVKKAREGGLSAEALKLIEERARIL